MSGSPAHNLEARASNATGAFVRIDPFAAASRIKVRPRRFTRFQPFRHGETNGGLGEKVWRSGSPPDRPTPDPTAARRVRDPASPQLPSPPLARRRRVARPEARFAEGAARAAATHLPPGPATTTVRKNRNLRPRPGGPFLCNRGSVVEVMSAPCQGPFASGGPPLAGEWLSLRPCAAGRADPRDNRGNFFIALRPVYPNSIHAVHRPQAEMIARASLLQRKLLAGLIQPSRRRPPAFTVISRQAAALPPSFGSTAAIRSQCPLLGTMLR